MRIIQKFSIVHIYNGEDEKQKMQKERRRGK
jgi:hypothetical protein